MKQGVPCVIGECEDERVRFTFEQNAQLRQVSVLDFACDRPQIPWVRHRTFYNIYETADDGTLQCPLCGDCQPRNANTVITSVHQLRQIGFNISPEALQQGFRDVVTLTHLRGRWETLQTNADGTMVLYACSAIRVTTPVVLLILARNSWRSTRLGIRYKLSSAWSATRISRPCSACFPRAMPQVLPSITTGAMLPHRERCLPNNWQVWQPQWASMDKSSPLSKMRSMLHLNSLDSLRSIK